MCVCVCVCAPVCVLLCCLNDLQGKYKSRRLLILYTKALLAPGGSGSGGTSIQEHRGTWGNAEHLGTSTIQPAIQRNPLSNWCTAADILFGPQLLAGDRLCPAGPGHIRHVKVLALVIYFSKLFICCQMDHCFEYIQEGKVRDPLKSNSLSNLSCRFDLITWSKTASLIRTAGPVKSSWLSRGCSQSPSVLSWWQGAWPSTWAMNPSKAFQDWLLPRQHLRLAPLSLCPERHELYLRGSDPVDGLDYGMSYPESCGQTLSTWQKTSAFLLYNVQPQPNISLHADRQTDRQTERSGVL